MIDTSYLQQVDPATGQPVDGADANQSAAADENVSDARQSDPTASINRREVDEVSPGGTSSSLDNDFAYDVDDDLDEQSAMLKEAIEQLEQAEIREAEALGRAETAEGEARRLQAEMEREAHVRATAQSELHALKGRNQSNGLPDGDRQKVADLTADLAEEAAQSARLKAEVLDEQRQRAEALARVTTAEAEVAELGVRARDAESQLAESVQANAALDAALKTAVALQTAAETKQKVLEPQLADAQAKLAEKETEAAKASELKAENERLQLANDDLTTRLNKAQETSKNSSACVASLERELTKAREAAASHEQECAASREELSGLQSELDELATLKAALAEAHERVETLEAETSAASQVHADTVATLKADAADVQKRFDEVSKTAGANDALSADFERQLAQEKSNHQTALAECETLRADLVQMKSEQDAAQKSLLEAQEATERLEALQAKAIEREASLQAQRVAAEQQVSSLEEQLTAMTASANTGDSSAPVAEPVVAIESEDRSGATSDKQPTAEAVIDQDEVVDTVLSPEPVAPVVDDEAVTSGDQPPVADKASGRPTANSDVAGTSMADAKSERRTPSLNVDAPSPSKHAAADGAQQAVEELTAKLAQRLKDESGSASKPANASAHAAMPNVAVVPELSKVLPPSAPITRRGATGSETAINRISMPSRAESIIQKRIARATATKERAKDNRRAKRVSARKLASLWQDGMSTALSCTMLDRSSSGAKLEIVEDRFNDRFNDISVGDRFMVTLSYAQERTSMECEVMWVAGRRCGVRFCGQIHTTVNKPPKRAMAKVDPKKETGTKKLASLFNGR